MPSSPEYAESPHKGRRGIRRLVNAFFYSLSGLSLAFRHESAFRQEVALAAVLLPLAVVLPVTPAERVLLVGAVLLVLVVELLNSSVEAAIDRIGLDTHRLSKRAKDLGSAAVLVALAMLAFTWLSLAVPAAATWFAACNGAAVRASDVPPTAHCGRSEIADAGNATARHAIVMSSLDDRRCSAARSYPLRRPHQRIVAAQPRPTPGALHRQLAIATALRAVASLREAALAFEAEFARELARAPPVRRESLRNLLHYLAVRRHDLRDLQYTLARLGLSSLGRMESHVLASLDAVLDALDQLSGRPSPVPAREASPLDFDAGRALLAEQACAILGPARRRGPTRIMVTLPPEAATDAALVENLIDEGMQIARINAAHDDPGAWAAMVRHVHAGARKLRKPCRISFDLAGPKLRIGAIEPGPAVKRWRVRRDPWGRLVAPARVVLAAPDAPAGPDAIPVEAALVRRARRGDEVHLVDHRGRERVLVVEHVGHGLAACTAVASAYVVPGIELTLRRDGKRLSRGAIVDLPALPGTIALRPGDLIDVVLGDLPGREASRDARGDLDAPAFVSCALPEVFRCVRVGDRVMFDDGRVVGTVHVASEDRLRVHVAHCQGGQVKLRGEKGINFPDSDLVLPALTHKDREDLAFAVRHAQLVALSFVQRPEDVADLLDALKGLGAADVGIVLKIETERAFRDLPRLLIAAMAHPRLAVMVARGDLGVEVGFERLSEVQEEILWLCEAAHVPVIWATQVLESLAKGGMPSRAEVTDAAMASRAECVMLNKGPYLRETLQFLHDVLARMQSHQDKKTALLRRLRISEVDADPVPRERKRPPRTTLPHEPVPQGG